MTDWCAACRARGSFPEEGCHADEKSGPQVVLTEGAILGGGAFSRVSIVSGQRPSALPRTHPFTRPLMPHRCRCSACAGSSGPCLAEAIWWNDLRHLREVECGAEETSGRQYAMKRMRKSAVVQCPEHVFCEQAITRNTAHPFCIRQYASFQVSACLLDWHAAGALPAQRPYNTAVLNRCRIQQIIAACGMSTL